MCRFCENYKKYLSMGNGYLIFRPFMGYEIEIEDYIVNFCPVCGNDFTKSLPNEFDWNLIDIVCELYGKPYDDRNEEPRQPGRKTSHMSLNRIQNELAIRGIILSTSKIRKILIEGGKWSTKRSREINYLFDNYIKIGFSTSEAIKKISKDLGISIVSVNVNLPYTKTMYNSENKSKNAKRCDKYRQRNENKDDTES